MILNKKKLLLTLLLLLQVFVAVAVERRRDQFPKDSNYLIVPAPYSIPGLGQGVLLVGYAGNIGGTNTDLFGTRVTGDVEGDIVALRELHLISERLFFELFLGEVGKAATQSYKVRGMGSSKDEFNYLETKDILFQGGSLIFSLWDRMAEFSYQKAYGHATFDKIRDKDGNLIAENIGRRATFDRSYLLLKLDYTDDFQDPRAGVHFEVSKDWTTTSVDSDYNPEQYIMDYNLLLYLPMGRISSWVFNYYQTDAVVTRKGETDLTKIEAALNIDCSSSSNQTDCESAKETQINDTYAQNSYGTASNLGGAMRLRGYVQNRFRAAHHRFYGTEFRWNLSEEVKPFDLFFINDIRTGIQIAGFYELATSADLEADLGKRWRSDVGLGIRVVARSGFVYRLDVASGNEGTQVSAFFNYPWGGF